MPTRSLPRTFLQTRAVGQLEVIVTREGSTPLDISALVIGGKYTTLAVGGFAGCTIDLPGTDQRWRSDIPYLSFVRIIDRGSVVYEGRVEDIQTSIADGAVQAELTIFGLSRLFDDNTVHKAYVKRDLPWTQVANCATYHPMITGIPGSSDFIPNDGYQTAIGRYDPEDQTKLGVAVSPPSATAGPGEGGGAFYYMPSIGAARMYLTYAAFEFAQPGSLVNGAVLVAESASGVKGSWNTLFQSSSLATGPQSTSVALSGAPYVCVGFWKSGTGVAQHLNNGGQIYNIRVTSLPAEDAPGGFYGDTVIDDLISLLPPGPPGLYARTIEQGNDFLIEQLDASTRRTMRDVLTETTSYYSREWGVWEDGAFDWLTHELSDVSWLIDIGQILSGTIKGSVEDTGERFIIQFSDISRENSPASEAIVTNFDRRNPWVRSTGNKDKIVSVGFPMTPNTAGQLAGQYSTIQGSFVPAQGQITLPLAGLCVNVKDGMKPAYWIRGGDTISIPGLYATEPFSAGRDGETVLHVISSDVDLVSNTVTLSLDSLSQRADVLLARLSEATAILTGS